MEKGLMVQTFPAMLKRLKAENPLIHHITNMVTVNDCANISLALGGAPAMADWAEDALGMVEAAGALVLNMGVMGPEVLKTMLAVGVKAKSLGVPVVFDPVGAGATKPRQETSMKILQELKPEIVKGNGAEIMFLAGMDVQQKGVDSSVTQGVEEAVQILAQKYGIIAVATGVVDSVSDGKQLFQVQGGSPFMGSITGTGCMGASALACFAAVSDSALNAALAGVLALKLSGENAAGRLQPGEGTGSFRARFLDAVSLLKPQDLLRPERIFGE